jgi:hypothetical protein
MFYKVLVTIKGKRTFHLIRSYPEFKAQFNCFKLIINKYYLCYLKLIIIFLNIIYYYTIIMIRYFCHMLLDFPDTIFGNCAPHKLPLSQYLDLYIIISTN